MFAAVEELKRMVTKQTKANFTTKGTVHKVPKVTSEERTNSGVLSQ